MNQALQETSPEAALQKAVDKVGSYTALAGLLQISRPAVAQWLRRGGVPPMRVLEVERLTGVSRHELRPDIYPVE